MAPGVNGISGFDQTGGVEQTRRLGSSDAARRLQTPDFAQVLRSLEQAKSNIQQARVSFQQADSLRPTQPTKPNSSVTASPGRTGGIDFSG